MTTSDECAFPADARESATFCGLTKREYFASMALQGILASAQGGNKDVKCLAAVDYADELIAALEVQQ